MKSRHGLFYEPGVVFGRQNMNILLKNEHSCDEYMMKSDFFLFFIDVHNIGTA